MPKPTPKSPELRQAQIATFASEKIKDHGDMSHILNSLSELAIGNLTDVTRVAQSFKYGEDEMGRFVRVSETSERTAATASEYTNFLRSVGGANYEAIRDRAAMLTQYNQVFKPIITGLRAELQDPASHAEHPAFMGRGLNSDVFRITHEGKEYAVRIPRGTESRPATIDGIYMAGILGKGVPHLEQIVTVSYEDGVTVAEVMPGKEMAKDMTVEDVAAMTDEQLSILVDTLMIVSERGIEIDPKPTNILYDRDAGFGIIDYGSSRVAATNSADQDLGTIVGWMATPIMNAGFYGDYSPKTTADEYAQAVHKTSVNLGVLKRFRSIVESKLDGEDRETALKGIDSQIRYIDICLNPEYVANQLARVRVEQTSTDILTELDIVPPINP